MPPKKSKNKNAFYFYMQDFKFQEEKRGKQFPGGLKDVAIAASPSWQALSSAERARYEEMAKSNKANGKGDGAEKYTTLGISFSSVDRILQEEMNEKEFMIRQTEAEVRNLTTKQALENKSFFLIHVNYYCITNSHSYLPAEISLVEFSLKDGIIKTYHTLVNPGDPPIGYKSFALEHSNATHQIPISYEKGEKQLSKILREIRTFIKADGDAIPPIYTETDSINHNNSISAVKSTLKTLCENDGLDPDIFKVFLIDKLFFELRNKCAQYSNSFDESNHFDSIAIAQLELERDAFSSYYHLACEFHREVDRCGWCSLLKTKGWAFLIIDYCCQDIGIDSRNSASHCPKQIHASYCKKEDKLKVKPETDKATTSKIGWDAGAVSQLAASTLRSREFSQPDFSENEFPSIGRGKHFKKRK